MNKKIFIWFFIILLIGSAIRFYNPTFRSLWGDEAFSFFIADDLALKYVQIAKIGAINAIIKPLIDMTIEMAKYAHVPFYIVFLSMWINMCGSSELILRISSIIFGILSVAIIYLLAKELFDRKIAFIASIFLALSPFAIFMSQEIRPYSLVLFFSLLSMLFLWKILLGKRSVFNKICYIACTVFLCLTHPYAILFLLSQLLFVLTLVFNDKIEANKYYLVLIMQIIIGVIILPFYLLLSFNSAAMISKDMSYGTFPVYIRMIVPLFAFSLGEAVAPWNWPLVLPALLIFGGLFLLSFKYIKEQEVVFLLTLLLFPIIFAVVFLGKTTLPKYLIFSLPSYLVLIARSTLQIPSNVLRRLIIVAIVVLSLLASSNYFRLKEYHNSNQLEPWRTVSSIIKKQYQKGDVIIYQNYFVVYHALKYYLNATDLGRPFKTEDPPVARYLIYDAKEIFAADSIKLAGTKRFWLVSHLHDEPGLIIKIKETLSNNNYYRKEHLIFIPYAATLASEFPMKRYRLGSARITLDLYVKR